jgi:Bacterial protein of unknown function (YtfJ_HI0045)
MRPAAVILLTLAPWAAFALPPAGARVPPVTVVDLAGRARTLPDPRRAVIVFYEDKDAGAQNKRAREVIGRFTDRVANREKFDFVPVADVEKWSWWPARRYVIADVRDASKDAEFPVLLDWKGDGRKSWGLTRGRSGVLILAADGRCLFAGEGTLNDDQLARVTAVLTELGGVPVGK